jgi:hypothetical protein
MTAAASSADSVRQTDKNIAIDQRENWRTDSPVVANTAALLPSPFIAFKAAGADVFIDDNNCAVLRCGVESGLFVLKISRQCNTTFYPNIKVRRYAAAHTYLGHVLRYSKKIVTSKGETWPIFGLYREEWPKGMPSSTLVDNSETGCKIDLVADGGEVMIEPSVDPATDTVYSFHTPLAEDGGPAPAKNKNPLWSMGIFTLNKDIIEKELLPAFRIVNKKKKKRKSVRRRNR